MTWRSHDEPGPDGVVHVWPETDQEPHVIEGGDACWCEPQAEFYVNGTVLVKHRDELDRIVDVKP